MGFALKFSDLTLDDVEEWTEESSSRVDVEDFPRRHGTIIPLAPYLKPRVIRMSGRVFKSTEAALKTYLEDLSNRLTEKGLAKLQLRDNTRYLNAVKSGFSYSFSAGQAALLGARFAIEFLAGDPFWYAATETTSDQGIVGASSYNFSIINNGKSKTPVRAEMIAVGANKTDLKLTNRTNTLFMRFSGTVVRGQTLIMNSAHVRYPARRVTNGSSNGLNSFTGGFWLLEVGQNNLRYEGPTDVGLKVFYTERWPG